MAEKDCGFASMPAHKRHEISSKGGKASHAEDVAHEWTSEEAARLATRAGQSRISARGTRRLRDRRDRTEALLMPRCHVSSSDGRPRHDLAPVMHVWRGFQRTSEASVCELIEQDRKRVRTAR